MTEVTAGGSASSEPDAPAGAPAMPEVAVPAPSPPPADEAASPNPAIAPPVPEPLLGRFTQADRRLLVITIGGTVAANLATALVIGLALVLARAVKGYGPGPADWLDLAIAPFVGLFVLGTFLVHRRTTVRRPRVRQAFRVYVALCLTLSLLVLLVWVGLATGLAK